MDLKRLETAVDAYYCLFCHRTRVLEGVRKIAWRNMIQFDRSVRWCVSRHKHSSVDEINTCISRRTLKDQGMLADEPVLRLTGMATFCSIHVYLALLYAEIDYYKRICASFPLLADKSFSTFLDRNAKWVEALGHSRDVFLHPNPGQLEVLRFINSSTHQSTAVQVQLNQYLHRIRKRLRPELERMCDNLPENDKTLCLYKLASFAHLRRQFYRDREGEKHSRRRLEKMHELVDAGKIPAYSAAQDRLKVINTLATCLDHVDPSTPELSAAVNATVTEDHSGVKQTPVSIDLLMSFVTERSSYGNNRHAMYAEKHKHQYFNMLFTSHLLLNEPIIRTAMRDLPEQYTAEQLARQLKVVFKNARDEPMKNGKPYLVGECENMQEVIEVTSLQMVAQALAYEPLRIYCKLVGEDASISEPELDKWTQSGKLSRLSRYRNSVFHVVCNDPDGLLPNARFVRDDRFTDIRDLYTGLAKFFGVCVIT